MPLFEPKIYKRNGLEAFRLVGSDGSEFFYEGALDCNDKELHKDSLGRLYYPVIAEIGGTVKYFVELDPQVSPIPFVGQDTNANAISRLVNASPRPDASLPEDIFVKPEAPPEVPHEASQEVQPELPDAIPQASPQEAAPIEPETSPAGAAPEPTVDVPLAGPQEHMKSPEAASAIHAVFSPKVDILHPAGDEEPTEETGPENEPAPPAKAEKTAEPPAKAPKKRSLKWPLAIGAILVILLAVAAGVYIVKPHTYDGLKSMFKGATPTPTPEPTVTPSPTPSPTPTPLPDEGTPGTSISELIDSDNAAVAAFAQAHLNESSNNTLRKACDLFDFVNSQWKYTSDYTTSRKASEIAYTLQGNTRDYTVLMTALLKSQGIPCRVVFSYPNGRNSPDYYPELLAANTSTGYQTVMQQLHVWYGIVSPQGHRTIPVTGSR
jgi:transglutaminase-like putative cysteine protease